MQKKAGATRAIFLAGIAGGTVEVVWVALYCLVSPLQASLIAAEITRSFLPEVTGPFAVAAGLIIHYALSVLVAGTLSMTLLRLIADNLNMRSIISISIAALVAVWTLNFYVILPAVNPEFVTLMPYAVTLASKIGFGIAMGGVFGLRGTASHCYDLQQARLSH